MRLLLGLAAIAAPSVALAQPSAAPASPPERVAVVPAIRVAPPGTAPLEDRDEPTAPSAAPAPLVGIAKRVDQDAAAGRAFFSDTALTGARRKVAIQVRMPAAPAADVELRYSLTDRIELGVSALVVSDEGEEAMIGFDGRGQIWHNDRAAVALGFRRYQATGDDDDGLTIPTVVATSCIDGAECVAILSLSLNGMISDDSSDVPVFAGVSWALGRKLQFVGEVHVSNDEEDSLTFGYVGVRAASRSVSFDAGLAFASIGDPACDGDCTSDESGAIPFLGVATRM